MTRLTSSIFAAALLASCIGNRSLTTSQLCPCAPGWSCDPASNTCVVSGTDAGATLPGSGLADGSAGSGGDGGSVLIDGSCSATCSLAAGTVEVLSSASQIYAAVAGSWQICTDLADWQAIAPSDVIGVEFEPASGTAGGNGYYLVQGPSGPVRGSGTAYQLTYSVLETSLQSLQFDIINSNGLFSPHYLRYSPCPTEVEFDLWPQEHRSVLVHF